MTAELNDTRAQALLTVDLEDYRWLALREHFMGQGAPNASEVMRQLEIMLALFEESRARATFLQSETSPPKSTKRCGAC